MPRRRVRIRRTGDELYLERRASLSAITPYLGLVRAPSFPLEAPASNELVIASYNLHRFTPPKQRIPDPERATFVISELGADVIALQEAIRPFAGDDPLLRLAEQLKLHVAFVTTRIHRLGELGNAILSRWPITATSLLDLSFSRVERRSALAAQLLTPSGPLSFVSTHLSLVHRRRRRQVEHLLEHPTLQGPVFLAGDMNAWRKRDRAGLALDAQLQTNPDLVWPATFPAARPILPLDRIYARDAKILEIRAHVSPAARWASDHLPVVARLSLDQGAAPPSA